MTNLRKFWYSHPAVRKSTKDFIARKGARDGLDLAKRAELKAMIENKDFNGYVVLVSSGIDCDGVMFSGMKTKVAATVMAVCHAMDRLYENAEGPLSVGLYSTLDVRELEYESRDLALEAFEDSHSYSLRP